jgi:hypothetical protein
LCAQVTAVCSMNTLCQSTQRGRLVSKHTAWTGGSTKHTYAGNAANEACPVRQHYNLLPRCKHIAWCRHSMAQHISWRSTQRAVHHVSPRLLLWWVDTCQTD